MVLIKVGWWNGSVDEPDIRFKNPENEKFKLVKISIEEVPTRELKDNISNELKLRRKDISQMVNIISKIKSNKK